MTTEQLKEAIVVSVEKDAKGEALGVRADLRISAIILLSAFLPEAEEHRALELARKAAVNTVMYEIYPDSENPKEAGNV